MFWAIGLDSMGPGLTIKAQISFLSLRVLVFGFVTVYGN